MAKQKRKHSGNSILRAVFVGASLLLQIGWILLMVLLLNQYSTWISLFCSALSALVVLRLYSRERNSAFKMPWIMLMMALPVMGVSLYALVELSSSALWTRKRMEKLRRDIQPQMEQDPAVVQRLQQADPRVAGQCDYLCRYVHSPVYDGTKADYYPEAAQAYQAMLTELEKAESFIFMEYFILEDGEAFDRIRQILARKASQGVEVRLMYDDVGSIGYVNMKFARQLNAEGIRCRIFNPALPVLNLFMNNRDHRKITVIDGKVAFTGGFNLANEYFTDTPARGHWKDTGLRLEGKAVRSLTVTFLKLWGVAGKRPEPQPEQYLDSWPCLDGGGFVQPYDDDPLSGERAAENVYLNMIGHAQRSVYFMTPYLIITDELRRALCLAAKRGVDVRIITPGIPDKKMVYQVTRSYYAGLARQGVRIYEFSPGFLHAKQCVCDGTLASIGTSNLDYRSLYLHFENDVLLYDCQAVADMQRDFENTFPLCREVTGQYCSGRSRPMRVWQCILRLFAPMM